MAEQRLSGVWEPAGTGEQERRVVSPEILDIEKYGALYGRFLLASLPEAKIGNIIDPTNRVRFNDLTTDTLKDRNYNPICENVSLAERKEQWEGREFSDAYRQWRTEFTGFMTSINDPTRKFALGTIMSDWKKAAFTEQDANQLFTDFCSGGRSDIDTFIKRVTTNLGLDKKTDSKNLKELLPHLEWIASGLFGKETASQVVTRLIELESEIQNKPARVMEIFNFYRERIDNPTDDETRVLRLLHHSLRPQEKRGPTQDLEDFTIAPKPAPVVKLEEDKDEGRQLGVPLPPPVEKTPGQEKPIKEISKENLPDQEINALMASIQQQAQSLVSNEISAKGALPVSLNKQAEELKKTAQSLDELLKIRSKTSPSEDFSKVSSTILGKIISIATNAPISKGTFPISSNRNLRDLNAAIQQISKLLVITQQPAVSEGAQKVKLEAKESSIPGFAVIPTKDRDKWGDPQVKIEINGKDTGFKWKDIGDIEYRVLDLDDSILVNPDKFPESLDLPEGVSMGLKVGKYDMADRRRYDLTDKLRMFQIIGRRNTKVPLGRNVYGIWLYIGIPEHMSSAGKPGEFYEWDKEDPIAFDEFKKLVNPQAPAESDLAPTELTPEIKQIFEIGRKPFSLADRPFSKIPREERSGIVINAIRQLGGTYND